MKNTNIFSNIWIIVSKMRYTWKPGATKGLLANNWTSGFVIYIEVSCASLQSFRGLVSKIPVEKHNWSIFQIKEKYESVTLCFSKLECECNKSEKEPSLTDLGRKQLRSKRKEYR